MKILSILLCLISGHLLADVFSTHDFEAGHQSNASFQWAAGIGGSRVFVVQTPARQSGSGGASLRFRYFPGIHNTEQRFSFGESYPDLWLRYWVQVPINFQHNSESPSNNKFLAIWQDDYSQHGDGATVIWETWNDGNDGSTIAVHYSQGNFTSAGSHLQSTPFIKYPDDQGRWMEVLVHVKASTGNNGVIEFYRRWENEEKFSRLHHLTGVNIPGPDAGPLGWRAGYFMGWTNPGYLQETDWHIDDIQFSDTAYGPQSPQSVELQE